MNRHTVTASWYFDSFIWNSSGFPLANHLALPGFEFIFGLSQGPPICAHTSLKMDSSEEGCWHHSLFWWPKSLSGYVELGRASWLQEWRKCSILSFIWAGFSFLPSHCYLHLGLSAHRWQTPAAHFGAHLSPGSLLLSPSSRCGNRGIEMFSGLLWDTQQWIAKDKLYS